MEGAGHELGSICHTGLQNVMEILGLKSANGVCTLGTSRNRFDAIA